MKLISYLAVTVASVLAFGCTEEMETLSGVEQEKPAAGKFSLKVNIASDDATKTVFNDRGDGNGDVEWADDDALAVYVSGNGEVNLYRFTKDAGDTFSTEEFVPAEGTDYTYMVVYPFSENSDPGSLKTEVDIVSGTYSGTDPDGNIDTPLWGRAKASGTAAPEVTLQHLASVIKVSFTNGTGASLNVSEVSLEAPEKSALSGTFTLNLETGAMEPSGEASSSAVLKVGESVDAGASASYYIACAPYSGALDVKVTSDAGTTSVPMEKVGVGAGMMYSTVVTAEAEPVLPTEIESLSISGAAAGGEAIAMSRTLENEAVYAWRGELQSGELFLSVNGTEAYLAVTNPDFKGTASEYEIAFEGDSWKVSETGVYRIVVDTKNGEVKVYDAAHDLKNKVVSYNNTVDGINPYEQEVTELWMYGGFNSFSTGDGCFIGLDPDYTLKQSLANPCIFVYHGDVLPRLGGQDANNGAYKTGFINFKVSNIHNNVYCYGSTADAKRNDHSGYIESDQITLGEPLELVGGQGDNRYAYFIIPQNVNYIEIDIENLTVVFDNRLQ